MNDLVLTTLRMALRLGFPGKLFWRLSYDRVAQEQPGDFSLMNYGYWGDGDALSQDSAERVCLNLYHRVASAVDLRNKLLLEVGSGRGGGLAYAARELGTRAAFGIDLSPRAVELARSRFASEKVSFFPGDAEALPFGDGSFDAVLNIESSHCYGSRLQFFREVRRVLAAGGHFLFADYLKAEEANSLREALREAGLRVSLEEDLTLGVISALKMDESRRLAVIDRAPKILQGAFRNFAGTTDGTTYRRFVEGSWQYLRFVAEA